MAIQVTLDRVLLKFQAERGSRLSYEELQAATGASPSTVAAWRLRGRDLKRVNLETLNSFCEFFGVGVGELLTYTPDNTENNGGEVEPTQG
jgi:DNA-binding Xre family transcriptional regulator